jgi:hypothetical protein
MRPRDRSNRLLEGWHTDRSTNPRAPYARTFRLKFFRKIRTCVKSRVPVHDMAYSNHITPITRMIFTAAKKRPITALMHDEEHWPLVPQYVIADIARQVRLREHSDCLLTMRLSDARLRRRPTKLFYPNHQPLSLAHRRCKPSRSLEPIVRRLRRHQKQASQPSAPGRTAFDQPARDPTPPPRTPRE